MQQMADRPVPELDFRVGGHRREHLRRQRHIDSRAADWVFEGRNGANGIIGRGKRGASAEVEGRV